MVLTKYWRPNNYNGPLYRIVSLLYSHLPITTSVMKFVSNFWKMSGFLPILRFLQQIKLTNMAKVALYTDSQ
jgi:hypothetical protein